MSESAGWTPDLQATFCATLVDEWVRCGLTDAVVCPGSRSTPLALALVADERVRVHVHHDERSGSFLALGAAAATGTPVVVLTTSGTAAVQLHAAVVESDLGGVPLLVCTADRPPEARDFAAPQTVDQERLFGRSVRWFVDAGVPDPSTRPAWRSLAARAWAEATAPWPGPVQVNLPFREPLVGRAGPLPQARGAAPVHRRLDAGREAPVLDAGLATARGVIVAGRGTANPDAVRALADALGWPLLADPLSGCRGSGAVAAFDSLLRTPFAERVSPEIVLRVGGPPASKVLSQWIERSDAEEVVVAPRGWWPDPTRRAALVLDEIPTVAEDHAGVPDWREAWSVAEELAQAAIVAALADQPMSEPALARATVAAAPPGAVVVASSSMPIRDLEWFGPNRGDVQYLANRGANGIDGVVSTAVGAAAAGRRTSLLIGDVAFLHDSNGLLGLADRGVDLTVVVTDNDGGGIFSFLPQRDQLEPATFERLFGTPHGLDLVAVARSFGVAAEPLLFPEQLEWSPGTRVLVARSDREANVDVHAGLHDAVARAVAG